MAPADMASTVALGVVAGASVVVAGLYAVGVLAGTTALVEGGMKGGRRRVGNATNIRSTTASGVKPGGGSAVYESGKAVDEYLLFHFADASLLMPYEFGPREACDFPARCASLVAKHASEKGSVADIGCAVGGASFHLARSFDSVVGLDFSEAFIKTAERLASGERLPCTASEEGILTSWFVASAPADVDCRRLQFQQGDACALPAAFGPFDAVLAANLLCRLPRPRDFLAALPRVVKPGGVAVLVSPYSWMEEYTPQELWLGGCIRDCEETASAPALKAAMEALGFVLEEEQDMPFLIREHARKFQYGCSHATVWRRLEQ